MDFQMNAPQEEVIVLSEHVTLPLDGRKETGGNHVLLLGDSGTGKTQRFIKPNILKMNSSYVIADDAGILYHELKSPLENAGYRVKVFDVSDPERSDGFNPLSYLKNEINCHSSSISDRIALIVDSIMLNTTGLGNDKVFVEAERRLLTSVLFYLIQSDAAENKGVNLWYVLDSLSRFNELERVLSSMSRDTSVWRNYRFFTMAAGSQVQQVALSCITRLELFLDDHTEPITQKDTLELEKLGEEKIALFVVVPQADPRYAALFAILFATALDTLYTEADTTEEGRLKQHVQFMLDNFITTCTIPKFTTWITTMGNRNISCVIALQSITPLQSLYGYDGYDEDWRLILNACGNIAFFGAKGIEDLAFFGDFMYSQKGELAEDDLYNLGPDECIIFKTGSNSPVKDKKLSFACQAVV